MHNDYFERWLAVKRAIESTDDLKPNIRELMHGFHKASCFPGDSGFDRGSEHSFARAGVVTLDPKEVHLALGLYVRHQPFFLDAFPLQRVLAYHEMFESDVDVPYFIGPVMTVYEELEMWGFLTEDVSEGGINKVEGPESLETFATVTSPNREMRRIFIDPAHHVWNNDLSDRYKESVLVL
tara:strand:+ start:704 stop:1246 length:543 start_codon:yes stop_codon:yes gene_type:complete